MASVRLLKKELNVFAESLKQEIHTYLKFHPEFSREKAVELTMEIEAIRKDFIHKIYHPDPKAKDNLKKYYTGLMKDIRKELDKVMGKLSAKV